MAQAVEITALPLDYLIPAVAAEGSAIVVMPQELPFLEEVVVLVL